MLSCARNTRIFPKNNPKEEIFPLSGHGLNELLKCMAIQRLRRFQSAGDAGRKTAAASCGTKPLKHQAMTAQFMSTPRPISVHFERFASA